MSSTPPIISDESLLGYLMNSLPDEEQRAIEARLSIDDVLRERLSELAELLMPLEESIEDFEPRQGLAAETVEFVASQIELIEEKTAVARLSSPLLDASNQTRWAWLDSVVALTSGMVLMSFLLPTVWHSREHARAITCSEKLRNNNSAFQTFAFMNAQASLPKIPVEGPCSFAGSFAIYLKDSGLLPNSDWLWCPSVPCPETSQTVPYLRVYLESSPSQQKWWRITAGGNLAYNLGYFKQGVYVTPKLQSNSYCIVMGDSYPIVFDEMSKTESQDAAMSSYRQPQLRRRAPHLDNTCNLLYSDGRVQLVRMDAFETNKQLDHPFLNRNNKPEAGLDEDDCCLGASARSPFPYSLAGQVSQ